MKKISELTQQDLIELISYDPITGKAYWNKRDVRWFNDTKTRTAKQECNRWNAQNAGNEITHLNSKGYIQPGVMGKHVLLHRLIWLREMGEWPKEQVDHINGIRTDNRIENLREATNQENCKNQRIRKNNTVGCMGINKRPNYEKWRVRINTVDKRVHIGDFNSLEEAIAARKAAEIEYGYSETHGRAV